MVTAERTRICPNCSTEVAAASIKCPNCGEPRPTAVEGGSEADRRAPPAEPDDTPRPEPSPAAADRTRVTFERVFGSLEKGPERFQKLVADGYSLLAVVGLPRHGKTDFIRSMIREVARAHGGDISQEADVADSTGGSVRTPHGTYNAFLLQAGPRLVAIWDIAGEDFKKLGDPDALARDRPLAMFLAAVLPLCRGVVLTLALPNLWEHWNAETGEPAMRGRSENLRWQVNTYVRFLQFVQLAPGFRNGNPAELFKESTIKESLSRASKTRIPVVVNFSKADACIGLRTPEGVRPVGFGDPDTPLPAVRLDPSKHDARAMTCLYVNELFQYIRHHVRHARFVYSVGRAGGDEAIDRRSMGCRHAFELVTDLGWQPSLFDTLLTHYYYKSPAWKEAVGTLLPG